MQSLGDRNTGESPASSGLLDRFISTRNKTSTSALQTGQQPIEPFYDCNIDRQIAYILAKYLSISHFFFFYNSWHHCRFGLFHWRWRKDEDRKVRFNLLIWSLGPDNLESKWSHFFFHHLIRILLRKEFKMFPDQINLSFEWFFSLLIHSS